jgi:hypothetical protein
VARIVSTRTFSLTLLLACVSSQSYAQGTSTPLTPPPSGGVFQGDQRDNGGRQSLMLTASAYEVYDSHIIGPESASPAASSQVRASGFYTSAQTGLFYAKRGRRVKLATSGDATFAYYPNLRRDISQPVDSYQGQGDISVQLGRSSLQASQSVSYQPYFVVQALPPTIGFVGLFTATQYFDFTPQVSLLDKPSLLYNTAASFTTPVGRRSSLDFSYGYQGGSYGGRFSDIKSQSGRVQFNHARGRNVTLRGSYTYDVATYQRPLVAKSTITSQDVEVGFGYRRPLSRSRSVALEAGIGGGRLKDESQDILQRGRRQQLTAFSTLDFQFTRSWAAEGYFRRSLQLLQGLGQPYYGNSVNANLHGGLTKRLDLSMNAGYSQGAIGIDARSRGYDTGGGSVRLRYALSRQLGLSVEYLRTQYNFASGAVLPSGVIRVLDRNSVRFGLVFGTSLVGRQPAYSTP